MVAAPLLILLVPLAAILWPVVLALVGLAWLVVWPVAAIAARLGAPWLRGQHARIGRAFRTLLRPWNYFDVPTKPPPTE
jgi:hypothetical protein